VEIRVLSRAPQIHFCNLFIKQNDSGIAKSTHNGLHQACKK
jgi:hypothetical protein